MRRDFDNIRAQTHMHTHTHNPEQMATTVAAAAVIKKTHKRADGGSG